MSCFALEPKITISKKSDTDSHKGFQVRFSAVKAGASEPQVLFQDYLPRHPGVIEYREADPGVNIHVFAVQGDQSLFVRVWERGMERTMLVGLNPHHPLPVLASSDGRVLLEVLLMRDRGLPT
jgi:hypothetical protein